MEQSKERDDMRNEIRGAVQKVLEEKRDVKIDESLTLMLELGAEAFAQRRSMLADSKSFVSDKDASMLGRAVAMNVIQFRTAMVDITAAIEGVVRLTLVQGEQRAAVLASMVDQIVLLGETALIAFIRLERHADRVSKQSIPELVWSVLRGR